MRVKRNIWIAYFLSFAFHSWFWLGNWVFYYMSFGSFATVALLDSGAVLSELIFEIPTGAFADIVGKKKTLMIAFLWQGLGCILMGLAGNFWMLALSLWFMVCVGGSFYSGTIDALVYDSLKSIDMENTFDKKIGVINAMRLWAMSLCGLVGGFIYYISPGMPYILDGVMCLIGFVACLFLVEPAIDTEKYSLMTFFKQNTLGIKTLFSGEKMRRLSIFLIATGSLSIVVYNLLDDLLAVEYGYSPMGISILFSIACMVAGLASLFVPRIKIKMNHKIILILSMLLNALVLVLSPIVGMMTSGLLLMIRVVLEVIYDNSTSVEINENMASNVRATTLSSLSLLRSIPYAVGGSFIGGMVLMTGGARMFAMWFGILLALTTVLLGLRIKHKSTN